MKPAININAQSIKRLNVFNEDCHQGSREIDLEILARLGLIRPIATKPLINHETLCLGEYHYSVMDIDNRAVSRSMAASNYWLLPLLHNKWKLIIGLGLGERHCLFKMEGKKKYCIILSKQQVKCKTPLIICRMLLLGLMTDLKTKIDHELA